MDALLFEMALWTKRSKTSVSFYLFDVAIEREEDYEHVYHCQLSHCWLWTFFSRLRSKGADKREYDLPF